MATSHRILIASLALMAFVFAILLAQSTSFFDFGRAPSANSESVYSENTTLVAGSEEKFNFLAQQTSSTCGLQPASVATYPGEVRIQGSCCSRMDLHRYQEQVDGLVQYSAISQIPEDPYDIPASLAKELLGYQMDIQLTPEQQAIYDEAMKLSDEGGPCCCKCWRWYAFEGMGKYLIAQQGWDAQELADLWDLTDGCGGGGHEHG